MPDLISLTDSLKVIKDMGFVKTHRAGPTGIGKTLEDLLGIDENNYNRSDLGELGELKSCRNNQASMVTLFTKSPLPAKINTTLLNEYGYVVPTSFDSKILHTTISANDFNTINGTPYGFKIGVDEDKVYLLSNYPNQINVYWDKVSLKKSFEQKLPRVIFVRADTKLVNGVEYFHFNEAYQLSGFDFEGFERLILSNIIKIDIRIGQYPDGRTHDHGTGFRVMNNRMDLCFSKKLRLV